MNRITLLVFIREANFIFIYSIKTGFAPTFIGRSMPNKKKNIKKTCLTLKSSISMIWLK